MKSNLLKSKQLKNNDYQSFTIAPTMTHHLKSDGTPAYSARFQNVLSFHPPGVAAVVDNTGAFHITSTGEELYPHRFDRSFGYYYDYAAVVKNRNWFHIDLQGDRVYLDNYRWVGNFQEKFCAVRDMNNRFFHIDLEGKKIYTTTFVYVGDFKYGIAVARLDNGFAIHINQEGIPLYTSKYYDLDNFHKGFARARDKRGWCHIDMKGEPIYSERYQLVEPFYNGYARVVKFEGTSGIIDESGNWVNTIFNAETDPDHNHQKLQTLFTSYWKQQTVVAAVKLGIFEYLSNGPKKLDQISETCHIEVNYCEKILHALYVMKLLQKSKEYYTLTKKGELLTKDHPNSLYASCLVFGEEHYHAWNYLAPFLQKHYVNSKKFYEKNKNSNKQCRSAFELYYNEEFFKWINNRPEKAMLYHSAMAHYAERDYARIVEEFPFSIFDKSDWTNQSLNNKTREIHQEHPIILDIGGGKGVLLKKLLFKYPNTRGILIDLKEAVNSAKSYLTQLLQQNRVELIVGDFFNNLKEILKYSSILKENPQRLVDSIFLSRVLHDWDDQRVIKLLSNCHTILKEDGKIYIIELVPPENPQFDIGVFLTLNLIAITGGKERTIKDYEFIFNKCGFSLESSERLGLMTVLAARRS
ncbi:MAG: acetylserotonin O-methyltransferase [Candidatus Lokiarchaeota archaeon]|nr:acetylserotonin O-methyltransferase [Candidatus Harpocratesius repetitus]